MMVLMLHYYCGCHQMLPMYIGSIIRVEALLGVNLLMKSSLLAMNFGHI